MAVCEHKPIKVISPYLNGYLNLYTSCHSLVDSIRQSGPAKSRGLDCEGYHVAGKRTRIALRQALYLSAHARKPPNEMAAGHMLTLLS